MKYCLDGHFYTDGDFWIDKESLEEYKDHVKEDGDFYTIDLTTEDPRYISTFLEKLIISYRVNHTHYWVVNELYQFTEKILNAIRNKNMDHEYSTMTGNYDYCYLELTKTTPAKLKPCPFCGGEAKFFTFGLERYRTIGCSKCGVQSPVYETIEQAIEAWNTRSNPWHTGTPTEKGQYIVRYKFAGNQFYEAIEFNGEWSVYSFYRTNEFPDKVKDFEWQKIEERDK